MGHNINKRGGCNESKQNKEMKPGRHSHTHKNTHFGTFVILSFLTLTVSAHNCFLLFVAWKRKLDTFRQRLWFLVSIAVFKGESGITFVLRSADTGHWNKKWYSFSISFMQKAQFLSREKTLYRCKSLFNGSSPNLACDTTTLKQYISVLFQRSSWKTNRFHTYFCLY